MSLSLAMRREMVRPDRNLCWLAEFETATDYLRCWSGLQTLAWDGHDWLGVGHLYGVETIDKGDALAWRTQVFTLNGLDGEALAGLDESVQGRVASLWLGALDRQNQIVPDPILIKDLEQDTLTREIDPAAGTVSLRLTCFEALPRFDRATGRKWSPDSQQARYADDTGMYYLRKNAQKGRAIDWRPA